MQNFFVRSLCAAIIIMILSCNSSSEKSNEKPDTLFTPPIDSPYKIITKSDEVKERSDSTKNEKSSNCPLSFYDLMFLVGADKDDVEKMLLPCYGVVKEGYERKYNDSKDYDFIVLDSSKVTIYTNNAATYINYKKEFLNGGFQKSETSDNYFRKNSNSHGLFSPNNDKVSVKIHTETSPTYYSIEITPGMIRRFDLKKLKSKSFTPPK
jgi:hypothetical protein